MVSPDRSEDETGATQNAAPANRAAASTGRADIPVYRPRNYRARAAAVAVFVAVIAALLVWLVLVLIL